MKKLLIAFMLLCSTAGFADWQPSAQLIPPGTSTEVDFDVYTTYDIANQTVVATWGGFLNDEEPPPPYYAVYNGVSWITPGTIIPQGDSSGVYHNIIPGYNASNGTVVAVWNDAIAFIPYYAVFDGTTWITPGTPIPLGTSTGAWNDIFLAFDNSTQTLIATWSDATSQVPYYSVFDGTTWTTADLIPVGASVGAANNVFVTYDPVHQTVIAAWGDTTSALPYYAIFNGTTWTTPGTAIPPGASVGVNYNVNLAFNPVNGTVIAAWGNTGDTTPYYAVFNGTTWTTAQTIPQGTSIGPYQSVYLAYDNDNQQVFGVWADANNFLPYYSLFNGSTWTTAALVPVAPSLGVDYDITLVYDPAAHQMVATWANFPGTADPYFNIFTVPLPLNLTGSGCCVRFATQRVWVNHLAWSPTLGATAYNIYRNEVFIGQVNGNTFEFNDAGNRVGDDVYFVTAILATGLESIPAMVTIPAHRSCR